MKILIKNKKFRVLLTSNVLSVIGTTLFDIVFLIYAEKLPNPELAISLVIFITTLPFITHFILGYLSDKTINKINAILCVRFFQIIIYIIFSLIVGLSTNWIIFGLILFINFSSDLLGIYTNYLGLPITKNILLENELTEARAVQSGIMHSIDLLGKLFGATLIIILNYNFILFGVLNTILFTLSFLIIFINRKNFEEKIKKMQSSDLIKKELSKKIKDIIKDFKKNFKILLEIKQIYHFTLIFLGINLISAFQFSLLPLTFINENLQIKNFGYTVAIFSTVESIGIIMGAFFPFKFLKNQSIEANLKLEIMLNVLLAINIIFLQNIIILLSLAFLSSYILGLFNPRIDAFLMIATPEESLSSVISIFYTLIQVTVPLGSAIALVTANSLSVNFSWVFLLIITIILLIYAIILNKKYSTIPEK